MEKRNEMTKKLTGWKHQFHQVKVIGPEPPLNTEGFWKKPKPVMVRFQGEKEERNARADR